MTSYRLVAAPPRAVDAPPTLDAAQRVVVEHERGPLLVLAGPGTGKTTTLVEAAVERVRRGVPVERLLLLTFSRRAAGELRDRIAARLGRTIREPIVRTLHSYAFGVLRMAAVRERGPAPRLLAAAEQDVVIRELLAHGDAQRWPAALRPALRTEGFAAELRDLLMRAVERGLDGRALRRLGHSRGRSDWIAAGEFLTEYLGVTVLRDPGGYDPAELIQGALNVLRDDPDLLAGERDRRRRVFVDEYQDTDPAQAQLLQMITAGADEVVLVGDPDQSIYAFRGADESALREVDERFGAGARVPVTALDHCRRSGPVLLTATRRVAARLPGPADQRALVAAGAGAPGAVDVAVFRSPSEEATYLAGVLRAAHLDGLAWSQMAVLLRSTSTTLGPLRRAMINAGVPVAVRGEDLPLAEQPAVRMLLDVLACVHDPAGLDDPRAEALLVGPLGGGDPLLLRRLRRLVRAAYPEVTLDPDAAEPAEPAQPAQPSALVRLVSDPLAADLLPDLLRAPVLRVAQVLAAGRAAVLANASTEDILWRAWQVSGLAGQWAAASAAGGIRGAAADRDLDAVVALFDEAAAFTDRLPNAKATLFAEHVQAQQIPGAGQRVVRAEPAAVAILTAHASKGLEWDLVCVAQVQEGAWPDLRRRGSLLGTDELVDAVRGLDHLPLAATAPRLAEERRLFYVATTRARSRLVVTAVAGDEEQPSRFLDELDPTDEPRPIAHPPRGVHLPGLVAELRAAVCDPGETAPARAAAAGELARLAAAGVSGADPAEWWGLPELSTTAGAADPDRPVPVRPSQVDSFLVCELRALMQTLGVADDEAVAASLGTLVHDLAAQAPDDQPLAEFERQLDDVWHSIDFGASWFAANERARAATMLARLVDWLRASRAGLTRVAVEAPFDVEVGDARITGRVDRLERDADDRLVVVDLKTGKTRPRDADVPQHAQLGTYQLAIEHGAFAEHASGDSPPVPGGAVLVQLGTRHKDVAQWQPPLATADDPQWARRAVDHVAQRMRGHEFTAVEQQRCNICDVRSCCPLQVEGRGVPS